MHFISSLLVESAVRHPDQTALVDERYSIDYGGLVERVEILTNMLLAMGVSSEGRVAILLEKSIEATALLLAVLQAGAIVVPINPKLKPQQIRYILADCGAELLITSTHRLTELGALMDGLDLTTLLTDAAPLSAPRYGRTIAMQTLLHTPKPKLAAHRRIDIDAAAILYTSGSTGHPKGVVVSHRNLVVGCQSVNTYLGTRSEDAILALLPISFDAGLSQVTTGLAAGAKVVLHTPLYAKTAAALIAAHRITSITAVPPMWSLLVDANWEKIDTSSVRIIANTGGHMNEALLKRLRAIFTNARPFLMYGLTEAFRSTYLDPSEIDRRAGSIGKAIPNAEILVLREDGTTCAAGEAGELVHRGALVTLGYWNAPEKTAERFRPLRSALATGLVTENAVWSGDIVSRDEEGFLYFIGRRDDMIKTSGYRISPTEIESVVSSAPGVREVAAFGLPAGDIGDEIVVTVVPVDRNFDRTAVEAYCAQELPKYMMPHILVLEQLPRSANGKVDRVLLRQQCEELRA